MPFAPVKTAPLPRTVAAARAHFQAMGWSYRSAAPQLGVGYQHLCHVLRGDRQSRRLCAAILALPQREKAES